MGRRNTKNKTESKKRVTRMKQRKKRYRISGNYWMKPTMVALLMASNELKFSSSIESGTILAHFLFIEHM